MNIIYIKTIDIKKIIYKRNIDLNIDPQCHEVISHKCDKKEYIWCKRDGFNRMHRWVYWKETGLNPEVVMHKCDNPKCININHLEAGTYVTNNKDRDIKERLKTNFKKGCKQLYNPALNGYKCNTKLNEIEVKFIKYWISKKYMPKEISNVFNISYRTILDIKNNKIWKKVILK